MVAGRVCADRHARAGPEDGGLSGGAERKASREEQQPTAEHLTGSEVCVEGGGLRFSSSRVAGVCAPRSPIHLRLSPLSPLLPPVRKK